MINTHCVFAIERGSLVWLAAYPTRQEAVDHVNSLRPDGSKDDDDGPGVAAVLEFAFAIEVVHFASFV